MGSCPGSPICSRVPLHAARQSVWIHWIWRDCAGTKISASCQTFFNSVYIYVYEAEAHKS